MTRAPRARAALLALTLLLDAAPGGAHTRSVSYSTWRLDAAGADVRARVSRLDLTRLDLDPLRAAPDAAAAAQLLSGRLRLRAGGEPCRPERPPVRLPAPEGWVVYGWRVACAAPVRAHSVESDLLFDVAPAHLHFARVESAGGSVLERVLTDAARRFELPAARAAGAEPHGGTSVAGYVWLGAQHIATGWDHLAFVLALLLLATTLREVAILVTGFTAAHSLTLTFATLGVLRPAAAPVEALIGFSIALVAAENLWIVAGRDRVVPWALAAGLAALAAVGGGRVPPVALAGLAVFSLCHFELLRRSPRPARLRAAVAFAFGLVHGFGFAGVLAELSLPTARLVPALFGFNVGVELGQLAAVALAWPALHALGRARDGRWRLAVAEGGSAAIGGLGLFWFVTRALA